MSPLASILLLLVTAKGLGELLERLGFPSMIGEITAGAILGPAILGIIEPENSIEIFADIGLIVLLFMSGAQFNLRTFAKSGRAGATVAFAGVAVPLVGGVVLGLLLGFSMIHALFIGIALSITSIGISVRSLIDLHQLKSDIGLLVVSSAVIDDVIGIVMLGILATFVSGENLGPGLFAIVAIVIIFFAVVLTIGKRVMVWLFQASHLAHTHEMPYSVALICGLLCALAANEVGLHYAIGAFIAGLILGENIRSDRSLYDSLSDLAFGFFVTLFFAYIGLLFPHSFADVSLPFVAVLVVVAFLSKIVGGYIGAYRILGNSKRSLIVGYGLVPRGEMALVVAKVSLTSGLITAALFSAVTMTIIITVFAAPYLIFRGFSSLDGH